MTNSDQAMENNSSNLVKFVPITISCEVEPSIKTIFRNVKELRLLIQEELKKSGTKLNLYEHLNPLKSLEDKFSGMISREEFDK